MKQSFLLLICINIFCCIALPSFSQKQSLVAIGKNMVPIDNLEMLDSLVNGRLVSTASFSMNLTDGDVQPQILNLLQASHLKNAPIDVSLWYGNHEKSVQRTYTSATTIEFVFPHLSAADRNQAMVTVKLRSASVKNNENAGALVYTPKERPKAIIKSNFSASLNGLPVNRISEINFGKNAAGNWVSLEISIADLDAWTSSLNNGSKKFDGVISLLAQDFRTSLKEIKLLGAEIVSMKRTFVKNEERIQRFVVMLKVTNVLLESLK